MTDITIPPEAVEAAAMAICAGNKWGEPCATPCSDCVPEARAALEAGLKAWPGIQVRLNYFQPTEEIVLPLKETSDD